MLVHTERLRLRQRSATKIGSMVSLSEVLHGVTATPNCDCDKVAAGGFAGTIAGNGFCTHSVRQVCASTECFSCFLGVFTPFYSGQIQRFLLRALPVKCHLLKIIRFIAYNVD